MLDIRTLGGFLVTLPGRAATPGAKFGDSDLRVLKRVVGFVSWSGCIPRSLIS